MCSNACLRAGLVDQRANLHALLQPIAHLQLAGGLDQRGNESVGDGALDVDAVGGDTGLARVAELGDYRPPDRLLQIGVGEDQHRRVAAQLQRELGDLPGRPGDQLLAHFRGAGEGDLAAEGVLQHLGGDLG